MPRFIMKIGDESLPLDTSTMLLSEAEECESLTGWTAADWLSNLLEDRARAVKFAYWLAKRRAGDQVAWAAIDFDLGSVDWELEDDQEAKAEAPAELGVTADAVPPTGPDLDQPTLDPA